MKIRVTKTGRSLSDTHSAALDVEAAPPEIVEATRVLYRPPSADGKPRYASTDLDVETAVRLGSNRLALIHQGADGRPRQWTSGVARLPPSQCREGWRLVTERSTYLVEVLQEGTTPRRPRRDTGSFPIYDPTPVPDGGLFEGDAPAGGKQA